MNIYEIEARIGRAFLRIALDGETSAVAELVDGFERAVALRAESAGREATPRGAGPPSSALRVP